MITVWKTAKQSIYSSEDYRLNNLIKFQLSHASADPCDDPSTSSLQFHRTVVSDGEVREYRLSAPNSDAGTRLPIVAAFHGGGGAGNPFPQEVEFDQLG